MSNLIHNEIFLLRFSCFPRDFKTDFSAKSRALFQVFHFLFCATFCSVALCFPCVKFTFDSVPTNKNESYDTIGIATFVLFFLSKMPVAQGFSAMGRKSIVSLWPRLVSLWEKSFIVKKNSFSVKNSPYYRLSSRGCFAYSMSNFFRNANTFSLSVVLPFIMTIPKRSSHWKIKSCGILVIRYCVSPTDEIFPFTWDILAKLFSQRSSGIGSGIRKELCVLQFTAFTLNVMQWILEHNLLKGMGIVI